MKKPFRTLTAFLVLLALILPFTAAHARTSNLPALQEPFSTPTLPPPPSPADIINAVNALRLSRGLKALTVHPVLMEVAAQQASALAASEGAVGHERPCGMTLGQQLLLMGFPLWGDLSLDGYRSENWVMADTAEQVISAWLSDDEHTNTMLSEFRSDIGAAVVAGGQTYYVVLETALKTSSGQHQSTAYDILTGIPMTQTLCAGFASGEISNYSVPVRISTARLDGDVVHEVKYGQTLWSLADQYKVSVEQIKQFNGLTADTIVPGWKLLIQKGATQPAPVTITPPALKVTGTSYPTAIPFFTATPTPTAIVTTVPLGQQIKQNSMVVAALLISFSFLLAGLIGWSKKKG